MKRAELSQSLANPPVIDYEGSGYQTDFWTGQGRDYEDAAERLALRRLLPPAGKQLVELGAGFGRLADLYGGYERVVLFDYSRSLLREATERLASDPKFVFVAGNLYNLPLATASFESIVMVRVMHHLADVPKALAQIHRVMCPTGTAVVEYANKRNLKAIGRWLLGRQKWSPWQPEPVEFVHLNYDFHPAWMWEHLHRARFKVNRQYAVSHFRLPVLKKIVPNYWLARADSWLFSAGGRYPLAPSVFVQLEAVDKWNEGAAKGGCRSPEAISEIFCCPICQIDGTMILVDEKRVRCVQCSHQFAQQEGIWDFKEPVEQ